MHGMAWGVNFGQVLVRAAAGEEFVVIAAQMSEIFYFFETNFGVEQQLSPR